jgi:N-acyl-L-homoserine lactone synthetase
MNVTTLSDEISAILDDFEMLPAVTAEHRQEAYRVRYQVDCVENDFLVGINGMEMDEFDAHAQQMLLCHRRTGDVVGTVRLVLPRSDRLEASFPMQRHCKPELLAHLPLARSGEGSRFALSKHRLVNRSTSMQLLRVWLMHGIVRMSAEAGNTHILAVMERSLLRLLRVTGVNFIPAGQAVEYHGLRQPAYVRIQTMLTEVLEKRPDVWFIMTDGGRYAGDVVDPEADEGVPAFPPARAELQRI